ncbi:MULTISPECIES: histidinol-phosphate transaminase [unclassified Bacillus (in: firmicutes)]|uniref:histidinol-phosphate transaminase n=1 Tax=unclassified Bacillus (in: firmicutes) TaxID=185979 RepID=UPI000B85BD70|nr:MULTISPECIES: histidinol-phosphate transaminase [unclassified Bacillus (in: firmicutes)]
MRWKKQLLTLTPYQPGKSIEAVKEELGLDEIVKLASNENPFGCSPEAIKAIQKFSATAAVYPDGYATNLRSVLAEKLGVNGDQLIFGNGSDEIIQIISRALLHPEARTVMASPTFPQYKHNAVIEGASYVEVPLLNGEHDLENMLKNLDDVTNIVWLCSPNNPTGTYISLTNLLSFLDRAPDHVLVVLDEAYYEYVVADDYYDSIKLLDKYKNLIILRTFSKIYGLASLRIGYGVSSKEIIRALEPAREPFNTNSLAQLAATASVLDEKFVETCRDKNKQGLQQFYDFCKGRNLNYFPSQGNFILINFGRDGDEVFQFLLKKGYIVRSGKALGFPESVRITVGSTEQNEGVIKAMDQFLNENEIATAHRN